MSRQEDPFGPLREPPLLQLGGNSASTPTLRDSLDLLRLLKEEIRRKEKGPSFRCLWAGLQGQHLNIWLTPEPSSKMQT